MTELKPGDRIRHKDGALGTVTSIQVVADQKVVEWKSCGERRVSNETVLTLADTEALRWRNRPSH